MNKVYYDDKGVIVDINGPHMDEGFRVAHNYTIKGLIAFSFGLAYLLSKFDEHGKSYCRVQYLNNGYGILKSIWKNNYYPKIYIGKDFHLRVKEFSLVDIEMYEDINRIIKDFYGGEYLKKFVGDKNQNDKSYNCIEEQNFLNRFLDENKGKLTDLQDELDKLVEYFDLK